MLRIYIFFVILNLVFIFFFFLIFVLVVNFTKNNTIFVKNNKNKHNNHNKRFYYTSNINFSYCGVYKRSDITRTNIEPLRSLFSKNYNDDVFNYDYFYYPILVSASFNYMDKTTYWQISYSTKAWITCVFLHDKRLNPNEIETIFDINDNLKIVSIYYFNIHEIYDIDTLKAIIAGIKDLVYVLLENYVDYDFGINNEDLFNKVNEYIISLSKDIYFDYDLDSKLWNKLEVIRRLWVISDIIRFRIRLIDKKIIKKEGEEDKDSDK